MLSNCASNNICEHENCRGNDMSPRSPLATATARSSETRGVRSEESRTHAARSARVCASAASLLIAREESDSAHRARRRGDPFHPFILSPRHKCTIPKYTAAPRERTRRHTSASEVI